MADEAIQDLTGAWPPFGRGDVRVGRAVAYDVEDW